MNSNFEKYYAINKFFLLRIGGWPYQSKASKILVPCILSIVHYSLFLVEALLLYDTWGDIDMAVECTITITPVVASYIKLINIVVNNKKFRRLLQLMNDHWELFSSESERRILRYYANISRKVTSYFAVYFAVFLIFYLLIPLIPKILDIVIPLNESRPLAYVYQAEYRMDKEKFYYPIVFHSYVTSITCITILFTVDTTYIVCVLHTCSLFTAVSQNLENITGGTDTKSDDDEKIHAGMHCHLFIEEHGFIGNDYRELMTCLKKHQLALESASREILLSTIIIIIVLVMVLKTLDSMFTQVTFILLFLNVLLLSVMGLQLINNLENTEEVIRYVFVTCAVFTHLICMCIPGQLLIDRSAEIFNKAYNSRWYAFSIKTRNLFRILLYRSFVPCTLTAGRMFVMSMTMCSSVLQTAMSYFMAFLSVK